MEKEELITDKIEFCYVFKHRYSEVVKLLRNIKKTNLICCFDKKDYLSDFVFSKGRECWHVGAEFSFKLMRQMIFYFKCVEYTEEEAQTKISWNVLTEPPTKNCYYNYQILKSLSENLTTIIVTWILIGIPKGSKNFIEGNFVQELHWAYSIMDKYLTYESIEKLVEEKICIKCPFKIVWNIIIDLEKFRKCSPEICDFVFYNDGIKKGTKITLISKTSKKTIQKTFLLIKEIYESENECYIIYESLLGSPKIPAQIITHSVKFIENQLCEVTLKHSYKEFIPPNEIYLNKIQKQIILLRLKQKVFSTWSNPIMHNNIMYDNKLNY